MTDSVGFALRYPSSKTPEERAAEDAAIWTISHPAEFQLLVKKLMSDDELKAADLEEWIMTHPVEFHESPSES